MGRDVGMISEDMRGKYSQLRKRGLCTLRQAKNEEAQSSHMRKVSRKSSCHPQPDQYKLRHIK